VRAPGELHTWTDRALDTVLLRHVTFGDSDGSDPAPGPPASRVS
jgi:hypothetical protein